MNAELQTRSDYLTEYLELREAEREIVETYLFLKSKGLHVMECAALEHLRKGQA